MNRYVSIVLAFSLFTALGCSGGSNDDNAVAGQPEPTATGPADINELVQGNNAFAFDLYRRLSAKDGNVVFSPYSISSALAMTYAGARGRTANEMAKVLHFTQGQKGTHPSFARLNESLHPANKSLSFELNVANALWGQRGYPFREQFVDLSQKCYGGGLKEVDFAADAEAARHTINSWVKEHTKSRIRDLLAPRDVPATTRLVLTNAVFFKAAWNYPFHKEETKEAPFHVNEGESVHVPMMVVGYYPFNYYSSPAFEIVELLYEGGRFCMLVLLPAKDSTLRKVEESLTAVELETAISRLEMRKGHVALPRFKVTFPCRLDEQLKAMGMPTAFSGAADFSGMMSSGGLKVTAVIHKAFIDVDERGTEAAAATAVRLGVSELSRRFSLRADRPFLYVLYDKDTRAILFMGRVVRP
jgi:serpin B